MQTRNKDSQSYVKFLAIIDAIIQYGDIEHPLTVKDIQQTVYQRYNFTIDYRLIKKYVNEYNEYFEDNIIQYYKKGRNDYYYFNGNSLDVMEAKAIVDLVYSSDFFTLTTKNNYKKRIKEMFSKNYDSYFDKTLNIHITKNENDQVFYNELDIITKAIQTHKKIRFIYQKPQLNCDQYKTVELAPIDTCFSNNEYYLLCQGSKDPLRCIQYRLDYVKNVEIIEDSHVVFDEQQIQSFNEQIKNISYMYGEGELEYIELDFDGSVYSNMIDKFGKDIQPRHVDGNIYRIQVKHTINSTFYAWIIGFGGKIQIFGNEKQVQEFQSFLQDRFMK